MDHNDFPRTDSAAQLTDAFRIFNELSQNLTASYLALQDQVAKLRRELAASRDERLKALIEKEKLANRLQLILTALPAGVMLVDRSGTVIDCNALARQFLGEPLVGRSWGEIASQRLSAVDGNPHQRLLANGDCVSVTVKTLGEEGGQIVLLSDVSEMRVLQRAVEQRKHLTAMGEMVAGMAHQVRTPLSTAILYASQLEKPGLKEAKRRLFAEKISERLRHLERQVNDMMVFAREGRMSMNMFSPSHLLSKLTESMDEMTRTGRLVVEIDNRFPDEVVVGNEDALLGALTNLIANAVQAASGVCRVKLTVFCDGDDFLVFNIEDDGPGIAAADRDRLFEPFYTTRSSGTGLGLAVVDSIARAHGGQVQLGSKADRGAVFILKIARKRRMPPPLPGGFCASGDNQREASHGQL